MRYEILFFWKEDCAPCAKAKPMLTELAEETGVPIRLLYARDPESGKFITAYNVSAVPTVVLLKDGRPIYSAVGKLINKLALAQRITE